MDNIDDTKKDIRLKLSDLRVEAKRLLEDTKIAIDMLDSINTEEDTIKFNDFVNNTLYNAERYKMIDIN